MKPTKDQIRQHGIFTGQQILGLIQGSNLSKDEKGKITDVMIILIKLSAFLSKEAVFAFEAAFTQYVRLYRDALDKGLISGKPGLSGE